MNEIIVFIEQYWGVTVVGGLTIGTLLTFAIVQVISLFKGKTKNAQVIALLDKLEETTLKYNEAQADKAVLTAQGEAEREAAEQVNAVNFKILSYLVAASKLPEGSKVELQADIVNVVNKSLQVAKVEIVDAVDKVKHVAAPLPDKATNIVAEAADQITDIFESLTKKKE